MLFYYDILVWLVAIGAAITLIEAMILMLLSRTETWWQVRTNRIVVSLDISIGLGFFASLFIYYLGSGSVVWTASFAAFAILIVMIVSHIWRLDQYLYKTEERYVKNTSMLVLDVIKLILLLGSCLLGYGAPVPVPL